MNDPDPTEMGGNDGYPDWYYNGSQNIDQFHGPDFGLAATLLNTLADCGSVDCFNQGNVSMPPESPGGNTYIIYLHAWDFGGRTNLMVTDNEAGNEIGQMWIPEGSHKNGIGGAWDIGKDLDGDGARDVTVMPSTLDPNADTTQSPSKVRSDLHHWVTISVISKNTGVLYIHRQSMVT